MRVRKWDGAERKQIEKSRAEGWKESGLAVLGQQQVPLVGRPS